MQYTIESRELTNEYTHRPAYDVQSRHTIVDATDAAEAIQTFVKHADAELVSFSRAGRSLESIATVKKDDTVFLVRVYAA